MSYFKLLSNCSYEFDKENGKSCIVELFAEKRYILSKDDTKLLQTLTSELWEDIEDENAIELAKKLIKNKMGYLFLNDIYVEEYKVSNDFEIRGLLEPIPFIDNLYIQLSNVCNMKCDFCRDKGMIVNKACNTCLIWKNSSSPILSDIFENIADKFSDFYIKNIIFVGLNSEQSFQKMQYLKKNIHTHNGDVKTILITNSSWMNDTVIDYCLKNKIIVNFTLLGNSKEAYKKICGNSNLFDHICYSIDKLDKCNGKYYITVLAKSSEINNILDFADIKEWHIDDISEIICDSHFRTIPNYDERKKREKINYFKNKNNHNCLNRTLAIDIHGNVRPCPEIDIVLGNVVKNSLSEIFRIGNVDKWWKMTKDDISICNNCIYRYGCEDCGFVELACMENEKLAKKICINMKHEVI